MHQLTQRVTAAVSATSGLAVAAALLAAPTAPAYAAPSAAPTSAPGAADRGRPTEGAHRRRHRRSGRHGRRRRHAVGLEVLRRGGNAVDAAVAAAATLGVTEPFSAGIGGGGFFVFYDARAGEVPTIDGRETAPGAMTTRRLHRPGDRQPYAFPPTRSPAASRSACPARRRPGTGRSPVGHARRCGRRCDRPRRSRGAASWSTRRSASRPPTTRPLRGVRLDREALPAGRRPARGRASGSATRDLAATYRLHRPRRRHGFYRGAARATRSSTTVQRPADAAGRPTWPSRPAGLTRGPRGYRRLARAPTHVALPRARRLRHGAARPSGGTTVGEALNILERFDVSARSTTPQALHHYLEASALAFADRNRYVGDGRRRRARSRSCSATASPPSGPADQPGGGAAQAGAAGDGRRTTAPAAGASRPRCDRRHREHRRPPT